MDESPIKKTTKILIFNFTKLNFLSQTRIFLVSPVIANSQDIGKEILQSLALQVASALLTSLSNILSILSDGAPRNSRGSSQSSLPIGLKKLFSKLGMNLFQS